MSWGSQALDGGRVRFRLWAPDRERVALAIRGRAPLPMHRQAEGWFEIVTTAAPGARYRFALDDGRTVADPASRRQEGGVHGWSVLADGGAYRWRCCDWRGRPWEETVLLEVHVGVLGGFSGVAEHLRQWTKLGFTAIELMPIAAFAGARNWGYDGVLPYAVAESYGTPDDLKRLIDTAHGLGMMIFLDVVYNHFGPEGNYLGAYASAFFDERSETPWGGAVAVERPAVRQFFIENALMWLREYRFDGLRFDAVHAIANPQFLDDLASEVHAALPNREVHLILENERNDTDRLGPGRYDAQWNDDFHNVMHVLLTGETDAYYSGFATDPTGKLARCLTQGFIYQGETPPGADHPRGKPSVHLPATAFVAFLQNHDQIGNRALGERLTLLTDPDRLRAATALLLLSPQIPLAFMGDESGSRDPFLFFTDFRDDLADAVREGRRREFAAFAAFASTQARAQIPDPNAMATFERSVPKVGPDSDAWRAFYTRLLIVRKRHIVPRLKGAMGRRAEILGTGAVAACWTMADGAVLGITINLGDAPVSFPAPQGETLFALGQSGSSASLVAWLAP